MATKIVKEIELISNGNKQTFEFQHALRILIHEKNKNKVNWKIVDSKNYEFIDNEIINKSSKGTSKESN